MTAPTKPSAEGMRVACAEVCGWKVPGSPEVEELTKNWVTKCSHNHFISPAGTWCGIAGIPAYDSNLNAMAEAVKVLTLEQRGTYAAILVDIHDDDPEQTAKDIKADLKMWGTYALWIASDATATQRLEAFLRVTKPEMFE